MAVNGKFLNEVLIHMKQSTNAIKAVYDDHLQSFLEKIGVYEKVVSGLEKCKFCGRPISLENLASVFPESGSIKYVCDDPECIVKMNNYFNDKL